MRLDSEGSASFGAVELWVSYSYYYVCADGFDDIAARVVCRELGFHSGKTLCCSAFGSTNKAIGVGEVQCTGLEDRFENCTHVVPYNEHSCKSGKYAAVVCAQQEQNDYGKERQQ